MWRRQCWTFPGECKGRKGPVQDSDVEPEEAGNGSLEQGGV